MKDAAHRAHWIIVAGLTVAVFMDAFNGTVFMISRLQIMGSFGSTSDEAVWVNLGYLIAKAVGLLAAAWIVDRFGEARSVFLSVTIIAAASLFCALTASLPFFITGRIFHGAAGAVLLVAAQTILFRLFPSSKQGLVQAVYAIGAVMAPTTLTPAVQGWLTDDFSWTWVFWLNIGLVPIALSCLFPCRKYLPNNIRMYRPFDRVGFGLLLLAMAALIYVLIEGSRWNWFDDDRITLLSLAGTGALIIFVGCGVVGQSHSRLFEWKTFTEAQFTFGFIASFIAGFVLFGSAFLISGFALNVLALPPVDAGLLLLPSSMTVGTGLLIAGGLITWKKFNPLAFPPLGIALVMAAMWMLSGSSSESGAHNLMPGLILRGLGLGFLFISITIVTLSNLRTDQVASGVSLFNFGRQMGGIIGVSFLRTYLDHQVAFNRRALIENVNPASLPFQHYQQTVATALTAHGLEPGVATESASAVIQQNILTQAAALSFNEAFFSLILLLLMAVPSIFLFKAAQGFLAVRR